MTAHPVLFGILCFGLGIALQAVLMLQGSFRSGDARRVGLALLVALCGMAPTRHERYYAPLEHVFISFVGLGGAFAFLFRDRLLTRIGGRLLLAWNILLIYVALRAGWTSRAQLILLAIPTAMTIANAFSDIDRRFGWKVFFHTWFSIILVVIAVAGFDTGRLSVFFHRQGPVAARAPLEMILAGAAFLYIVTNVWFVLALVPIKLKRGQTWHQRMQEIHRHMSLLARGYVWEREDPWRSLGVMVVLPLLLFAVARWGAGNDRMVVPFAIALMPLLGGRAAIADEPIPMEVPARVRRRARHEA